MRLRIVTLCFVLLAASGCSLFQGADEGKPEPTPTTELPTPVATPTLIPTPGVTATAVASQPTELNIWLTPELAPDSELAGSQLLADYLASFDASHPELTLNIEIKSTGGQGGTLNYLRTGRDVAPTILPDLIIISSDQLATAAVEELIFPLDALLNSEMIDDLYPAARTMSRVGTTSFGYPYFLTNFQQVAYNDSVLDEPFPSTWEELLQVEEASFLFPAAGPDGAELALQFYLAFGGQLADEANQPVLEVDPLSNALLLLSRGRNTAFIAPTSQNITSLEQAWGIYANSTANIVQTEAPILLGERENGDESRFSLIPGPNGPGFPLLNGWLWAVSTPDPVRQTLAAELLSWLSAGSNMGEWSFATDQLPSRRSAFETWTLQDDYVNFLRSQLEFSLAFPKGATSSVMNALSEAVFDVVSQTKTPRAAAEDAAAKLAG